MHRGGVLLDLSMERLTGWNLLLFFARACCCAPPLYLLVGWKYLGVFWQCLFEASWKWATRQFEGPSKSLAAYFDGSTANDNNSLGALAG